MSTLMGNLRKRRVFQIVGIYLGAVFGLLEFTDMIVGRYALSDNLVDMVLLGMLSMLPTVMMLAYFHGAPGKDQWNRVEKLGIPINVLASLGVLLVLFQGSEVGAVSELRQVTDEYGAPVAREVAKASYVQPIGIYFFDADTLPENDKWLSYALPEMLSATLDRDSFMYAGTPYQGYGNGMFWQIRRAGYENGLGLPLSLQQRLASNRHWRFFVRGKISRTQQQYQLSLQLYETETLHLIAENLMSGDDLFKLIEEAVPFIKSRLEVQSPKGALVVQNLPVRELLTPSFDALRAYVEGKNARLFDNDFPAAIALWEQAIDTDPDFVAPHLDLLYAYNQSGDVESAIAAVQEVLRLGHKLPEEVEIRARATRYQLRQETDMARGVYEMWVQLYPESSVAINHLARHYQFRGSEADKPLALEAYQRSLELNPNQDHVVSAMANLNVSLQNFDRAIEHYEEYHRRRPNDYFPLVSMGDIKLHRGDFEGAQADYQKGSFIQGDMVTPVLKMAEVAVRTGNFEVANARLDDAELVARAPRQNAGVLRERIRLSRLTGRPRDAFEYLDDMIELQYQYAEPIDVLMSGIMPYMDLYVELGELEQAGNILERESQRYEAPLDALVAVGYLIFYLAQQQPEQAAPYIEAIETWLTRSGVTGYMYQVRFSRGVMQRQLGNLDAALARFEEAEELLLSSFIGFTQDDNRIDLLAERGETELENKAAKSAQATAQELLQSWPHHPRGNVLLARASLELGEKDEAREALERALEVWSNAEPDFVPAIEARDLLAEFEPAPRD